MVENRRVAAFGDAKRFVEQVSVGDHGVLLAPVVGNRCGGKGSKPSAADGSDTLYRDVEFVTPVPQRGTELRAMPFGKVREITGRSFYWARTIKVPFLSKEEATRLVEELLRYLGPSA